MLSLPAFGLVAAGVLVNVDEWEVGVVGVVDCGLAGSGRSCEYESYGKFEHGHL